MAKGKRFFWIKLKEDFFNSIEIRRLLNMKNGAKYVIILQKIMLSTVRFEGYLTYQGYEKSLADQIALVIDEKPKDVDFVLHYLDDVNWLLQYAENPNLLGLKPAIECLGSETDSAQRMRNYRTKSERRANFDATMCEKSVTMLRDNVTLCTESDTSVTDIQRKNKIESDNSDTEFVSEITLADIKRLQEQKNRQA